MSLKPAWQCHVLTKYAAPAVLVAVSALLADFSVLGKTNRVPQDMPHPYLRHVLEMARPFTPEDYEHLYGQESLADVDFKIQDKEDEAAEVSLPAHSVVLLGQSEYCMIKASNTPNSATL
jgi:hypothetical protein